MNVALQALLALAATTAGAVPTTSTETIPSVLQQVRIGNTSVAPDSAMSPPVALVYHPPIYTAAALQAGIEGVVTVRAEFDSEGNLQVLEIVDGLGFGLDEMALAALETWQFRPAYRAGRRVRTVANIDVEFHLPADDIRPILAKALAAKALAEAHQRLQERRHQAAPDQH